MVFILKTGDSIIRLWFEADGGYAPRAHRLKQRQAAAIQQIMHKRRDENGLAGARKAGDAEP
ncbi:hypothetical protein D3C80_1677650 [compost metagenome]